MLYVPPIQFLLAYVLLHVLHILISEYSDNQILSNLKLT